MYITYWKIKEEKGYMMRQILIATHGKMASGIRYTLELAVSYTHLDVYKRQVLFRIISAMRVYDLIVAMTGGGPAGRTETVSMYAVNTYFTYGNTGYGATLSVLMLLLSVVISLFFVDSLKTRGSV